MSDYFKALAASKAALAAKTTSPAASSMARGSSLLSGPETVGISDPDVSGITGGVSNIDLSASSFEKGGEGMKQKSGSSVMFGDVKSGVKSEGVLDRIAGIHGGTLGTPGVSLVALFDKPGETVCCVPISSTKGGDRACGEVLVNGVCAIKAHSKMQPLNLPWPAVFAPAAKAGRGGVSFYYDESSYFPIEEIKDEDWSALSKAENSKAGWCKVFANMRLAAKTGGVAKKLKFENVAPDLIETAFTPAKKREEDDLSPTGSEFSFEFVPEDYAEIPPAQQNAIYDLLQDLKALDKLPAADDLDETSTFLLVLNKIMGNLYSNQQELHRFSMMHGDQATFRLNELVRKVNALAIAGTEFQRKIGSNTEFEDATGYSTVLDGMMGLYRDISSLEETLRSEFKASSSVLKDEILKDVGQINTRVESLRQAHEDLKLSFERTMNTLGTEIMPDLLKMQAEYNEQPTCSLGQRVRVLESKQSVSSAGVNLLSSLVDTGAKDRHGLSISSSSTELAALLKRIESLEEEQAANRQKISDLESKPVSASYSTPEPAVIDTHKLITLDNRLSALEGRGFEVVTILGYSFCGPNDCEQFLKTQGAFHVNKLFLGHDMVSLVDMSKREGESLPLEDFMSRDDKTGKGGFSDLSAAGVYASMQNVLPNPLTIKNTASTKPLPRVDTFEKWDQQDGEHGVRYEISRGVENNVAIIGSLIDTQLAPHPEALRVFRKLLDDARMQWAAVSSFLSDRRGVCFHQGNDADDAWRYPSEVVRGIFNELYKVRSAGAMRSNLKELVIEDATRMFWGVLRCHRLMAEFVNHRFMGHPKLTTYSIDYLHRNRVTSKQVELVNGKIEKLQGEVNKINSKLVKNKST